MRHFIDILTFCKRLSRMAILVVKFSRDTKLEGFLAKNQL